VWYRFHDISYLPSDSYITEEAGINTKTRPDSCTILKDKALSLKMFQSLLLSGIPDYQRAVYLQFRMINPLITSEKEIAGKYLSLTMKCNSDYETGTSLPG
jgi:hypothetical protein